MYQEGHLLDVIIKKDFFVKSRKDNIKDQFDFLSVIQFLYAFRFLGKELMEQCTRQRRRSIQILSEPLRLLKRKTSKINKP